MHKLSTGLLVYGEPILSSSDQEICADKKRLLDATTTMEAYVYHNDQANKDQQISIDHTQLTTSLPTLFDSYSIDLGHSH